MAFLWSSPNSNPLQDIRDFLAAERAKPSEPYYVPVHVYERVLMEKRYGVAVVSGGLDSTTMIYHLLNEGYNLDLVSFDYGQRHRKEISFARSTAKMLGLKHDVVDLTSLTKFISSSALTSKQPELTQSDMRYAAAKAAGMLVTDEMLATETEIEVPDGHYAEETMKATVVPNRNMIMLSIAAGIAVNRKANFVATAVHSGDHFIYPKA